MERWFIIVYFSNSRFPVAVDAPESADAELRKQTLLRFNYFLGYHHEANNFAILVKDLRSSTSFFSFLSSLPEVLDSNVRLGSSIMNIAVSLLSYCASTQSDVTFNNRIVVSGRNVSALPPHCRGFWMRSLFILLFKVKWKIAIEWLELFRLSRKVVELRGFKKNSDTKLVNQSINQSINQSSLYRSINQAINWIVKCWSCIPAFKYKLKQFRICMCTVWNGKTMSTHWYYPDMLVR